MSSDDTQEATMAADWLSKQGYWITEIVRGDGSAREWIIDFGAVARHLFDTDMVDFATEKGWEG